MKHYICLAPALAFFTSGCSALDGMFASAPPPPPAFIADMPAAAPPPPPDHFCERVAGDTRAQALAAGFDAPTQERMYRQSLEQCGQLHTAG